jgi:hypothetical protein
MDSTPLVVFASRDRGKPNRSRVPILEVVDTNPGTQSDLPSVSARCSPMGTLSAWSWSGPELYSLNGVASGIMNPMHDSQRFEQLLDTYRRPARCSICPSGRGSWYWESCDNSETAI